MANSGESLPQQAPANSLKIDVLSSLLAWLSGLVCIYIFFAVNNDSDPESLEALMSVGYRPAGLIWSGSYWALLTSVFVHTQFWHLALNVYLLWQLGFAVERAIGSTRFLLFFTGAAFVSSSLELAMNDDTGIGASGVVYALFGFMWFGQRRYPQFRRVLNKRTIALLTAWLFACVAITQMGYMPIGNGAHFAGLAFGVLVANAFLLQPQRRRALARMGLAALVVAATVPLAWCPWSILWVSDQAYRAHVQGRLEVAVERYSHVIQMDPRNTWAYEGRSNAYLSLGDEEKAQADWAQLQRLQVVNAEQGDQ